MAVDLCSEIESKYSWNVYLQFGIYIVADHNLCYLRGRSIQNENEENKLCAKQEYIRNI